MKSDALVGVPGRSMSHRLRGAQTLKGFAWGAFTTRAFSAQWGKPASASTGIFSECGDGAGKGMKGFVSHLWRLGAWCMGQQSDRLE